MAPDWLGSPQHLVAGVVLGAVVVAVARRCVRPPWVLFLFAVGLVAVAEIAVEVLEYPVLYGDDARPSAYYDTVADLLVTLVGGAVGAAATLGVVARRASVRRSR